MNHAARYAWTRGQRHGRRMIPKPTRLGWTIFICILLLTAIARMAILVQNSPASNVPIKGPGVFSDRDSKNLDCAVLMIEEMFNDTKEIKRTTKETNRLQKGELPGVMK